MPAAGLTVLQRAVLARLAFACRGDAGFNCWLGQRKIITATGGSERGVQSALKVLEQRGYVVTERPATGRSSARRRLNPDAIQPGYMARLAAEQSERKGATIAPLQAAAADRRGATIAPLGVARGATIAPNRQDQFHRQEHKSDATAFVTSAEETSQHRNSRSEPEEQEDWFSQCLRLHNRECNGSQGHALQLDLDADRLRRAREAARQMPQQLAGAR
jgi:hypothetical protein